MERREEKGGGRRGQSKEEKGEQRGREMGGPRVRRGRTLRGGAGTASAALPGLSSAPEGPEGRGRPLVPSLLGGSWAVRHQALSWVLKTQPSGAAEPGPHRGASHPEHRGGGHTGIQESAG